MLKITHLQAYNEQLPPLVINYCNVLLTSLFSHSLGMRRSGSPSREVLFEIVEEQLIANPRFLSVWPIFDRNQFDGKDSQYLADTLYESSEEMAASAEELSAQAESMNDLISYFK